MKKENKQPKETTGILFDSVDKNFPVVNITDDIIEMKAEPDIQNQQSVEQPEPAPVIEPEKEDGKFEPIGEPEEIEELEKEYGYKITDVANISKLEKVQDKAENAVSKKEISDLRDEVKKLIDEGILLPFDEEKNIDDYNVEEMRELIKANIEESKTEAINDFTESLPEPVQMIIKYAIEGGENYPNVLRMAADALEGKNIVENLSEKDAIRTYLKMKGIEDEEVESLIRSYETKGIIKDKYEVAKKELNDNIYGKLDEEVKNQETVNNKKKEAYQKYVESVNKVLDEKPFAKEDKKAIIEGLTKVNRNLSNGVQTNDLYYLLEKYQFVEPKLDLVAEAYMLLSNPEKYKEYVRNEVKKEVIENTVKPKLKKAERSLSSSRDENVITRGDKGIKDGRTIKKNIFKFE